MSRSLVTDPYVFVAVTGRAVTPPWPGSGVPEIVAVPSPLSEKESPVGRVPASASVGAGTPSALTLNEPAVPVVKVASSDESVGSGPTFASNDCDVVPDVEVATIVKGYV